MQSLGIERLAEEAEFVFYASVDFHALEAFGGVMEDGSVGHDG